ncbi:CRAL-TRIO domain-containing protein [Tribonema minus]|uniref:CRAL-TRIO domain-containing protein n=1 Tax=Tribonema minus TaxID=303371 RepID=A0A835ZBW0_9STRA|nr:CRAL-TRIO domain-containing protein [Tribonema minus]
MYYEKLGGIDVEALKLRGVGFKQLLWHYMYQMEYLWSVICPRIEDRSTIVLDMHGVNMKDIGGEVLQFIKVAVAMLATHYPARSNCIFIINVPTWFSMVFRLIRPLLNEGTRQKIRPYDASQYQNALREWVDSDELPREYGGTSPHPLFQHPWEQELVQHVRTTLSKANAELEAV